MNSTIQNDNVKFNNSTTNELMQWHRWTVSKRKIPHSIITDKPLDAHAIANDLLPYWMARDMVESKHNDYDGIGFYLKANDPFTIIDLDHCRDPETGDIRPWALDIMRPFDTYWEVSSSGTGLHGVIKATKPQSARSKHYINKSSGEAIEIYDRGHFIVITLDIIHDMPVGEYQGELDSLCAEIWKPVEELAQFFENSEPVDLTTSILLDKARRANGTGEVFARLFDHGHHQASTGNDKSMSGADWQLITMLTYWFGRDPERMRNVFLMSALAPALKRKDNPSNYLERTILNAIASNKNIYNPSHRVEQGERSGADKESIIADCLSYAVSQPWRGQSGPSQYALYKTVLTLANEHGITKDDGVEFYASEYQLTEYSGIGDKTTHKQLAQLVDKGLITVVEKGNATKSTLYHLKPIDSKGEYKYTCKSYPPILSQTNRVRGIWWPENHAGSYMTEQRIGKRAAQILDIVYVSGGVSLDQLTEHLEMRKNNLKDRYINKLLEWGFLVGTDGVLRLVEDFETRLDEHLYLSGSYGTELRLKNSHTRQRNAHNYWKETAKASETTTPKNCANTYTNEIDLGTQADNTIQVDPNEIGEDIKNEENKVKNYPQMRDGIYEHGALCTCFFCDENAPEYIEIEESEVAA